MMVQVREGLERAPPGSTHRPRACLAAKSCLVEGNVKSIRGTLPNIQHPPSRTKLSLDSTSSGQYIHEILGSEGSVRGSFIKLLHSETTAGDLLSAVLESGRPVAI